MVGRPPDAKAERLAIDPNATDPAPDLPTLADPSGAPRVGDCVPILGPIPAEV